MLKLNQIWLSFSVFITIQPIYYETIILIFNIIAYFFNKNLTKNLHNLTKIHTFAA